MRYAFGLSIALWAIIIGSSLYVSGCASTPLTDEEVKAVKGVIIDVLTEIEKDKNKPTPPEVVPPAPVDPPPVPPVVVVPDPPKPELVSGQYIEVLHYTGNKDNLNRHHHYSNKKREFYRGKTGDIQCKVGNEWLTDMAGVNFTSDVSDPPGRQKKLLKIEAEGMDHTRWVYLTYTSSVCRVVLK